MTDTLRQVIEDTLLFAVDLPEEQQEVALHIAVRLSKLLGYDFPGTSVWCPEVLMARYGLALRKG